MKISCNGDQIEVNLRTNKHGGTAVNQFVDSDNTEVYYGDLHASVNFLDIGLCIIMDPVKGDWGNAKWARDYAWESLMKHLRPNDLQVMFTYIKAAGNFEGQQEARYLMRRAMGV